MACRHHSDQTLKQLPRRLLAVVRHDGRCQDHIAPVQRLPAWHADGRHLGLSGEAFAKTARPEGKPHALWAMLFGALWQSVSLESVTSSIRKPQGGFELPCFSACVHYHPAKYLASFSDGKLEPRFRCSALPCPLRRVSPRCGSHLGHDAAACPFTRAC